MESIAEAIMGFSILVGGPMIVLYLLAAAWGVRRETKDVPVHRAEGRWASVFYVLSGLFALGLLLRLLGA